MHGKKYIVTCLPLLQEPAHLLSHITVSAKHHTDSLWSQASYTDSSGSQASSKSLGSWAVDMMHSQGFWNWLYWQPGIQGFFKKSEGSLAKMPTQDSSTLLLKIQASCSLGYWAINMVPNWDPITIETAQDTGFFEKLGILGRQHGFPRLILEGKDSNKLYRCTGLY